MSVCISIYTNSIHANNRTCFRKCYRRFSISTIRLQFTYMKFPNQWIASNFSNIDCCISYYICRFPCSSLCVINFPASSGSTDTRRFPVYSILTIFSVFAIISLITFRTNSRLTRIYSIKEPIVISTNSNFSTVLSISSISSINAIFPLVPLVPLTIE